RLIIGFGFDSARPPSVTCGQGAGSGPTCTSADRLDRSGRGLLSSGTSVAPFPLTPPSGGPTEDHFHVRLQPRRRTPRGPWVLQGVPVVAGRARQPCGGGHRRRPVYAARADPLLAAGDRPQRVQPLPGEGRGCRKDSGRSRRGVSLLRSAGLP